MRLENTEMGSFSYELNMPNYHNRIKKVVPSFGLDSTQI